MVQFFKSVNAVLAASTLPKDMKIAEPASVQSVARVIAGGAMKYYTGTAAAFADLPAPYYWWQCGALMGAMLDYSHYTHDKSYDQIIATALLAQVNAPKFDFMPTTHYGQMGNDDLGFWGFAVMSAAERNFPQPESDVPSWLRMGENIWNQLAGRWDMSACNGGLRWQIFPENPNGLNYKNSVSNGGFFQLSARLARATGNQTYADWAAKVFDWSRDVGFIQDDFHIIDGAGAAANCTDTNLVSFTYNAGIYMYGSAVMANHTGDRVWAERAAGILGAAGVYFSPFDNATNVLYEPACEPHNGCSTDAKSHKGYLARFMYSTTLLLPELAPRVEELLYTSARAAAATCTGGEQGTSCSHKWYLGTFDGNMGLGQEMCALETIQGILADSAPAPYRLDEIKDVRTPRAAAPAA